MTLNRSALPQRSPYPLAVPCTCVAPASTAARVLATAQAVSLWQWMPSRACVWRDLGDDVRRAARHHAAVGVAQDDDVGAGLGRGRARPRGRTPDWRGSRRRSARRRRRPAGPRPAGARRCRAPSRGSPRAWCAARRSTCRSHDLPTRQTTGAPDSRRCATCGSSAAAHAGPAGRAERGQRRGAQRELGLRALEELRVLGVGARPAALDEARRRARRGAARS